MEKSVNPIYDYICSRPVRLKQLLKQHLQAFPENIRPYLRMCLENYSDTDRAVLDQDVQNAIRIVPEAKEQLEYAWNFGCLSIRSLTGFDQILKKIVQIIKNTGKEYLLGEKISLIGLLTIRLPLFRYEEAVTYALYNDEETSFLGVVDLLGKEKEYFFYPFIRSVVNVLEKDFSLDDLQNINQMLSVIHTTYQKGKTAGIELLEYWIPNIIMYHDEKCCFVDPSIEYKDTPANTWEIGESVRPEVISFGDIPFAEKGFSDHDLVSSIRSCIHDIQETVKQPEILPSDFALAAKKELNVPINYVTFVEAGRTVGVSIMEFMDQFYVLYKDCDIPHGLFGMSLENGPTTDKSVIFYPIDPDETYKIQPVKI